MTTTPLADPHEIALRAYEQIHGPLPEHQRRDLLAAGRERDRLAPFKKRDPIGGGATPGLDHRTRANRSAVASVLREYFGGTLDRGTMTKPVERSDSVTGAELADRMVSRLEISTALVGLRRNYLSLWLAVTREYRDNLTRSVIAERWRKSPATVTKDVEAGLDVLIASVFVDLAV